MVGVPGAKAFGVIVERLKSRRRPILFARAALCLFAAGLLHSATVARAQTSLPPVSVEAKKATAKSARPARQSKTKAAKAEPAPKQKRPETSTRHVDGYVAKVTGTGSKTDTPLLLVPQSVSVVTSDQIRDQGAKSIIEALRYTPGVQVGLNSDTRYDETYIRGFRAIQYLDSMPVPLNQWFATPRIEPYGLERIEALKGPASFLFGQNSPGGLLNMISKRPTGETQNEIQLEYGSFNHLQTDFDFSGPASRDGTLLYRLTGVVRDSDTVVDDTRDDVFSISPAFTWRPSAETSITVLANYGWDKGTFPHQYLPASAIGIVAPGEDPNPNGRLPRSTFAGEPGWDRFEREQWAVGYELRQKLAGDWTFRQSLRYASVDMYFQAMRVEGLEADNATVQRGAYAVDADAGTFTVDNQLQKDFRTGLLWHRVLVGTDYLRMTGNYAFLGAYPPMYGGTVPSLNLYNPVYGAAIPQLDTFQSNYTEQTQLGAYAQDQIKLGSWLLTVGGRKDWAETTTDDLLASSTFREQDQAFTGRAGLTYVFPNGIAPYVSYATSFQPTIGVDAAGQPYKPMTGRQYEAGIKYQPPGGKLYLAAAVFDILEQNYVTYPPYDPADPTTAFGRQTGEVSVRGFEIEARAKLTRNIDLLAAYTYLDTEVTASSNPDEVGTALTMIPMHQASIWGKYTFLDGPLRGLSLGAGVRYVGETLGGAVGDPLDIPDHTLVDAGLTYDLGQLGNRFKGVELSLNVTNLFDEYYVAGYCDRTYCSLGPGRVVLSTLRYRW